MLERAGNMLNRVPKIGDRVILSSERIKGTVTYVDEKHIFVDHYFPIQIELDKPYDDYSEYRIHRSNMKNLRFLRKRRRKVAKNKRS